MKNISFKLVLTFVLTINSVESIAFETLKPENSAIASAHPLATQAGLEILSQGGNAFDAAVAVSAVLAVVEPYSSGIGGGGFWLLHRASDSKDVMLDGREKAPLAATRDMYLDEQNNVVPDLSINGALAAGIPGEPAALVHMAKHYGQLPLSKTLGAAINYARNGFPVTRHYQKMAGFRQQALTEDQEAASLFLQGNKIPPIGYLIKQPDLANTLERLATNGHAGFYSGEFAQNLVKHVRENGGIWSMEDLAGYVVVEREPLKFSFRDWKITSVAPPSSGGVALATMLNILSEYPLETMDKTQRTHVIIEAMRRAYADRSIWLGDSDFVDVPVKRLISKQHAVDLASNIHLNKATSSQQISIEQRPKGTDTTHFSILDTDGNYVSATLSINYPFGSCFVPEGSGVLLNDEMDDFSAKPGTPNVYGLVGAQANAIQPAKRMLSSMSPTFLQNNQSLAIIGTPGGSRIITMVLLAMLDAIEGNPVEHWVSLPRYHHQYLPDILQFEDGAFTSSEQIQLEKMGHKLEKQLSPYGNMQAILWDKKANKVSAASDPRVEGMAEVKK